MFQSPYVLTGKSPKIIYVAKLSFRPKGAGFFGVPYKLSNGLTRAGCNVINFSDDDVARASSIFRNRKTGAKGANRKLVALAKEIGPDIIILGHADTIRPSTLEELRSVCPNTRLAQWSVDPLFLDEDRERVERKIDRVDWTFSSTGGEYLQALGRNGHAVAFLPNPVDPSIERARNFTKSSHELPFDLFYAAGYSEIPRFHGGIQTTSGRIVERIVAECPTLRGLFPGAREGSPHAFGAAFEQALASAAMGLNISRRNDVPLYSSDRFAQLAGSGILTFLDRATGYPEIFGEDEFAFYSTEDEMIDKIRYFHAHDDERRSVARKGWQAYVDVFDTTKVASYMVGVIMGEIDPAKHVWHR
ncbi:glycosyltransferase [Telmatospirillum siberiense]|uniref:glycosyltransferase family protein n=1 Tax=Telmatospirillum siberiense TaxID=382514 RepID=UPI001A7E18F8|nr:glycosyltransferase [Telmatospirillum siberiense]